MRRLIVVLFLNLLFFLNFSGLVYGQGKVNVYFFWSKTCPYCAREKPVIEEIAAKHEGVDLYSLEISTSLHNAQFMQKAGEVLDADVSGVPFTVIGNKYLSGWSGTVEVKKELESTVVGCLEKLCPDPLVEFIPSSAAPAVLPNLKPKPSVGEEVASDSAQELVVDESALENLGESGEGEIGLVHLPGEVDLPFVGKVQTKDLSLPVLTFVIALLDGFNPCAMWVLLFLISLLLGIESRLRRWVLGISFLLASGLVYFLFLAAWLEIILFVGFVFWARLIVGVIAIGVGVKNLRDWYLHYTGCVVGDNEQRQRVFKWIRAIISRKRLLFSMVGIVLLAFAVNLVELVCSFALPAAYAQTLALNELSNWQYYLYLLFYIFVFLVDDLLVFVVAMVTLEAMGIESKYARLVALIGGVLMVFIGLALILRPELLMFGGR